MFSHSPRFRLQVKKDNMSAVQLYELLSFAEWRAPKTKRGKDSEFKGVKPNDSKRMFMHAEVDEVLRAATSYWQAKPAKAQLDGHLWQHARTQRVSRPPRHRPRHAAPARRRASSTTLSPPTSTGLCQCGRRMLRACEPGLQVCEGMWHGHGVGIALA